MKTYLGDGLFVEEDPQGFIKLTTNDGVRDTNTVYLEPDVWDRLKAWVHVVVTASERQGSNPSVATDDA